MEINPKVYQFELHRELINIVKMSETCLSEHFENGFKNFMLMRLGINTTCTQVQIILDEEKIDFDHVIKMYTQYLVKPNSERPAHIPETENISRLLNSLFEMWVILVHFGVDPMMLMHSQYTRELQKLVRSCLNTLKKLVNKDIISCSGCTLSGFCKNKHKYRLAGPRCSMNKCIKNYIVGAIYTESRQKDRTLCQKCIDVDRAILKNEVLDDVEDTRAILKVMENLWEEMIDDKPGQEHHLKRRLKECSLPAYLPAGSYRQCLTEMLGLVEKLPEEHPHKKLLATFIQAAIEECKQRQHLSEYVEVIDLTTHQSDGSSQGSKSNSDAVEGGSSDEKPVRQNDPKNIKNTWPIDDIIMAVPSPPHSNENQNADNASGDNDVVFRKSKSVIRFEKSDKSKVPLCGEIISARLRYSCLTDHSYYQNRPHNLEYLGIQTPSESEEEEIDVVNDNGRRLRDIPVNVFNQAANNPAMPVRRPRGRPRNSDRRPPVEQLLEDEEEQPAAKRPRRCQAAQPGNLHDLSPQDRRNLHNRMEKERRVNLKNLFENLREMVPNVMSNPRTSKVAILNEATDYIEELKEKERILAEIAARREELERLEAEAQ